MGYMSKYVRIDRRYNNPYRLTRYAQRALLKWGALLVVWALLIDASPWLAVLATIGLVCYAVHRYRINHPRAVVTDGPGRGPVAPAYTPTPSSISSFSAVLAIDARVPMTFPSRFDRRSVSFA